MKTAMSMEHRSYLMGVNLRFFDSVGFGDTDLQSKMAIID